MWYEWAELKATTHGFSQKCLLGEGDYGSVYKGMLKDGCTMAVKRFTTGGGPARRAFYDGRALQTTRRATARGGGGEPSHWGKPAELGLPWHNSQGCPN
jgi:hypothetical protein